MSSFECFSKAIALTRDVIPRERRACVTRP